MYSRGEARSKRARKGCRVETPSVQWKRDRKRMQSRVLLLDALVRSGGPDGVETIVFTPRRA